MASAEEQIEALWGALFPAVEKTILQTGGFTPVGAVMYADGRIEAVVAAGVAAAGKGDPLAGFERQMRGKVAAGGVAAVRATNAQVKLGGAAEPVVGTLVRFDNAEGVSQVNFMAYTLAGEQIEYGELHGQDGAHDLFS